MQAIHYYKLHQQNVGDGLAHCTDLKGNWSIKASVWRGKIQIVSSVMADDLFYHFSDEEDGEDTLLDGAFDRWEPFGGGSARGPFFQFHMQPIGRRRRGLTCVS